MNEKYDHITIEIYLGTEHISIYVNTVYIDIYMNSFSHLNSRLGRGDDLDEEIRRQQSERRQREAQCRGDG